MKFGIYLWNYSPGDDESVTTDQLYRLGGLGLLLGAVLAAITNIITGVLFPDMGDAAAISNPLNTGLGLLGVVGTTLALLGLPALYLRVAREGGVIWLVGVICLALTGLVFGIFMGLTGAVIMPSIASGAPQVFQAGPPPSFFPIFIFGTFANVLGAALMGFAIITRRLYPRWCGYVLLVGGVLAVLNVFTSGPNPNLLAELLNTVSALPLFVPIGWIGYLLWSRTAAVAELTSRRTVAQAA